MEQNASGIISYAGLGREALLAQARAAFIQADPPVPRRFEALLPIFPVELVQNMDWVGPTETRNASVAPSGFSTDAAEYHRKMYALLPGLYADDNYNRNFDYEGRFVGRGVFTVDRTVADHFPQYTPFMGEKLTVYLIGGGFQAVAVPESLYPRGGGLLQAQELAMGVTARVEMALQYIKTRIAAGERYDGDAFAADYLRVARLSPVTFTQDQLSRILQDLSIVRSLQSDTAGVGLYTRSARKAERVFQYVPMHYACDLFAPEAVDKHTARLAQLHFAEADYVSDMWIPWQDFAAFIDRRSMTLNVRALCEAWQIAPRYDADTGGGAYPDQVRVAVVRDRELQLMVGEAINNPAYGGGMGPQGNIGRHVYITDSREMLRQRKLALEEAAVATGNAALPPAAYRRCLLLAVLQEHKGRLVDAMYRRETVLAQIEPNTPVYEKAMQLLDERVQRLADVVRREAKQSGMSQMSGYDADIDYLTRKQKNRAGEPQTGPTGKPIAFAPDPLREQSIESGYAMRVGLLRMTYAQAALPEPPAPPPAGADDSEDEPDGELLPSIKGSARKAEAAAPAVSLQKAAAFAQAKPAAVPAATAQAKPAPLPAALPPEADEVVPDGIAALGKPPKPQAQAATQPQRKAVQGNAAPARDSAGKANIAHPYQGFVNTGGAPARDAADTVKRAPGKDSSGGTDSAPESAATGGVDTASASAATGDLVSAPVDAATDEFDSAPESAATAGVDSASASAATGDLHSAATREAAADAENAPARLDANGADNTLATEAADAAKTSEAGHAKPARVGRVSLRELSRRLAPEAPPAGNAQTAPDADSTDGTAPAAPDDATKPKLAYILRRGSEGAASQSYSRMSEMLKKKEK